MKQVYETSVGTVEVRLDHESRTISAYRFDDQRHAQAAAIEMWDYVDLVDVFNRQLGVPSHEAHGIAAAVRDEISAAPLPETPSPEYERASMLGTLKKAGVPRRFLAVLIDGAIVWFPLSIVIGLMTGGGYAESREGYARAGIVLSNKAYVLVLAAFIGYYIFNEALTGATLGKRVMRIRVVDERGAHPSLGAAVVRNLLRPVDALFLYLVGVVFALSSPLGQRLGDRVAHTVVVRR